MECKYFIPNDNATIDLQGFCAHPCNLMSVGVDEHMGISTPPDDECLFGELKEEIKRVRDTLEEEALGFQKAKEGWSDLQQFLYRSYRDQLAQANCKFTPLDNPASIAYSIQLGEKEKEKRMKEKMHLQCDDCLFWKDYPERGYGICSCEQARSFNGGDLDPKYNCPYQQKRSEKALQELLLNQEVKIHELNQRVGDLDSGVAKVFGCLATITIIWLILITFYIWGKL